MKSHELARKLLGLPDLDVVSNESYCGGSSIVNSVELVKSVSGYSGSWYLGSLEKELIEIQSHYKESYKQSAIEQVLKRIATFKEANFDAIYIS